MTSLWSEKGWLGREGPGSEGRGWGEWGYWSGWGEWGYWSGWGGCVERRRAWGPGEGGGGGRGTIMIKAPFWGRVQCRLNDACL